MNRSQSRRSPTPLKVLERGLAIVALIATGGCATVFGGVNQTLVIQSFPSGATYAISSLEAPEMISSGSLPALVTLSRRGNFQIDVSLDGYEPKAIVVSRSGVNPWLWANLILWPGFIVDLATGAAYKLAPGAIAVTLERGSDTHLVVTVHDTGGKVVAQKRHLMTPIH